MKKRINVISSGMIHAPGMFRWIREAVARFDQPKAAELLLAIGFPAVDAVVLADPATEVKVTPGSSEDGRESILIEFDDGAQEELEDAEALV